MTQNRVEYKEFIGSVNYSDADECFFGKIEGINDLVTFEGSSVKELKKVFRQAVDDYLELCKQAGKEPYRVCKGFFQHTH
jgi:predicted HicB family RNase H-like nuclease